jgi:DNA polymerase-3 subunit delta'
MLSKFRKVQPNVIKVLENSFDKNRLSHAYIFEGPKGTRKFEIAIEVARQLLCADACGTCNVCRSIDANSHPNLIAVTPDGASVKKEQIKNLISELNKTSLIEGPRVYIINHIDKMTQSAANSLLKYFEEPHPNVYAILLTENIGQILPTIISRAQTLTFSKTSIEVMKNELLQRGIKEEFAFIAPLVTNNLDEAIDLCESEEFSTMLEIIYELGNIIANKYHTALIYFKENGDFIRRSNVDLFLNLLMYYYKDILNYQMNYELNFPFDRSLKIMRNIPRDEVMQNLEFILASRASLRYNPNINLMLDRVLAKLDWR